MNALRKTLPVWISIGLIVWLIYRVSLGDLLRAAARLPWQVLAPMTAAVVIVMYFWDVVCLLAVFAGNGKAVTYSQMLHLRGASYLVGAFNQGLGQAALAWDVARFQGTSFIAALSRSVLLGWHEGVVLAAVALAGSLWTDRPEITHIRFLCIGLLSLLFGAALVLRLLPADRRQRLQRTRWGAWLGSWTWRHSSRLILLRSVYFAIVGAYVATALHICGLRVRPATALAVIPWVLMASVLPSVSGLGTRETALSLMLRSAPADVLLTIGLIWSAGVIIVRLAIGLTWLWCGERFERHALEVRQ